MYKIVDKLMQVEARLQQATTIANRSRDSVTLLAVSKGQPAQSLQEAFAQGQRDFGENYLQEALDKQETLRSLPICWHFIGPIQSNKSRAIAENFAWVHSVDRLKIAQRLNDQRPPHLPPLNICLQVNIDDETSKSGAAPNELPGLAQQIQQLPRLKLRGLMALPAPQSDPLRQRQVFAQVRTLRDQLGALLQTELDTLSMGMSADLEAAIAEGATIVRVGTDIFGARH